MSTLPDGESRQALTDEVVGLRGAYATRPSIEQAKGILMSQYGVGEGTAFAILRRVSMSSQIKVRELASLVTHPETRTDPSPLLTRAHLSNTEPGSRDRQAAR